MLPVDGHSSGGVLCDAPVPLVYGMRNRVRQLFYHVPHVLQFLPFNCTVHLLLYIYTQYIYIYIYIHIYIYIYIYIYIHTRVSQ